MFGYRRSGAQWFFCLPWVNRAPFDKKDSAHSLQSMHSRAIESANAVDHARECELSFLFQNE